MLGRFLRITLTTIVALIVISILLACWFLFTTEGNREITTLLSPVEPRLQLNIQDGNLLEGIKSDALTWTDDNLVVEATGIDSRWNSLCLLAAKFCVDELKIDTLRITSRSGNSPKNNKQTDITLPTIKLPIALEVKHLEVGRLILDYSESAKAAVLQNIKLQAESEDENISIKRLSVRFKNYIASISGKLSLNGDYPLDIKLAAIAEDLFERRDLSVAADLSGSLSALRIDATSYGIVDSQIRGSINTLAPSFPLFAEVNWQKAGWPLDSHKSVLSTAGSLKFQGDIDGLDTTLTSKLSGENIPASTVTINGYLNPESQFNAKDIAISTLDGMIQGSAKANWQRETRFSSSLYFSGLNPAHRFPELPGKLAGNLEASGAIKPDNQWELSIEPLVVQGNLLGTPLHAHAVFSHTADDIWHINDVYLVNKLNKLVLKGEVSDKLSLKGNLDMNALDSLIPGVSGGIKGSYSVAGSLGKPDIKLDLQSPGFAWKDVSVTNLAINTEIHKLAESESHVRISASKIVQGKNALTDTTFIGKGTLESHDIQIVMAGPESTGIEATIFGKLSKQQVWNGQLQKSNIDIPAHSWALDSPMEIKWDNKTQHLDVAPHCWKNRSALLCLDNNMQVSDSGVADLSLENYSLSNLNAFLPKQSTLSGSVSMDTRVAWGKTIPNGYSIDANLKAEDGSITINNKDDKLTLAYQSLAVQANSTEKGISTRVEMKSQDLGTAMASFSLLTTEKPLIFDNGLLDLDNFDISFLQAFLPKMQTVDGNIFADLKFSGPVNAPEFSGEVSLWEPKFISDDSPLQITGGNVKIAIDNKDAKISGKIDSGNGLINLGGNLSWKDSAAWHLSLKAAGDALVFRQKPLVQSVIAPDLTISVRPGDVEITGKLKIIAAAITIREIPEGATSPSSDIVILDEKKSTPEKSDQWRVNSVVEVELGDAVRLSAYGLRAQLTGDMKLVQKHDRPLELYGEIAIPEGTYKSYGQDLTIEDGQILLIGPVDQTSLNIEAYRQIEDVRAGLLITGDIESPVLTLQSEPPLEQERILAYIVLGRDIAAGENNDSNILATAALSMGIKNGRGLATDIAETFGVKEFNIEASGRGEDTQVLLSGRLSSRLLVRYGVGVFTPVNTLYLRYDLSKKLYLETAQGVERAVDLFYSMEF